MSEDIFARIKREREEKLKNNSQPTEVKTTGNVVNASTFSEQQPVASPPISAPVTPEPVQQPVITSPTPQHVQQPIVQPTPQPVIQHQDFDGTPVKEEKGLGIMDYGGKGDGKTVLAFSVINLDEKSTVACLSFDEQSQIIKDTIYNSTPRIQVFDALKYFSAIDDETILESSVKSFNFWVWLLKGEITKQMGQPDWVIIDGLEIFKEKVEYKMRAANNLQPFETFANYGFWHQRTNFMDLIDIYAKQLAKKGVIYTSYISFKEVKTTTGVTTIVEPKWAGNTKTKTRIVIKVDSQTTPNGREFYATVESSKVAQVPTSGRKLVGSVDNKGNINLIGFKALLAEGKTLF